MVRLTFAKAQKSGVWKLQVAAGQLIGAAGVPVRALLDHIIP